MLPVNSNISNISAKGRDSTFIQEQSLEPYIVVFSVTAHVLSMLFGGVGCLLVSLAVTTPPYDHNIFTLGVLPFNVFLSIIFWNPVEIADPIIFYYYHKQISLKMGLYLLSILIISFTVTFISMDRIILFKDFFGPLLKKTLALCSFLIAVLALVLWYFFMITTTPSAYDSDIVPVSIKNYNRSFFLAVIALAFCPVATTMVILLLLFTKKIMYWENGRPCLKKIMMELQEFLKSQPTVRGDINGRFTHGRRYRGTQSPTMPKLLMVGDPETSFMSGEDSSLIYDLRASKQGNRLEINMAQVLSHHRHTICHISKTSTPMDTISRGKQYNYISKSSADIAALQAQLQNLKTFRDPPYQSAIDLSKKQPADNSRAQISISLLALKPLHGNLEVEKMLEDDKISVKSEGVGITFSPLPANTVTDDDTLATTGGDNIPIEVQNSEKKLAEENKPNVKPTGQAQKPTTLNVDVTAGHISVPTLESATTTCSSTELKNLNMVRLNLYFSLTFVLSMLPVLVTEMLRSSLSIHAFSNISTCMLALSTIQTIVYPCLIVSSNAKAHQDVCNFIARIKRVTMCKRDMYSCHHSEDSSSIV